MEKNKRKSGILLHITSLPGENGIGTMGEHAFKFIDVLKETNQKLWQILPLGPVGFSNSPYQCYSAFAGNPQLISLEKLVEINLLNTKDLAKPPRFTVTKVNFQLVRKHKEKLLKKSFEQFKEDNSRWQDEFNIFNNENGWWLDDYALFMATKKFYDGLPWTKWSDAHKFRDKEAIDNLRILISDDIYYHQFLQFIFFKQWNELKKYANDNGIEIIGDMPLYVAEDSADVWLNTDIFELDEELKVTKVGGVPPDYFSETGQLWGNPVYNWQRLQERNYDWWIARMYFNLRLFDQVRIDHFRGLAGFWSIDAGEKTAEKGEWLPAHGRAIFEMLKHQNCELNFIAEDLGVITPDVEQLRDDFELPGMKIVQFAFSSDEKNVNLPHNYTVNYMVNTGTHDNDTTIGWFESATKDEKKQIEKYLGDYKSVTIDDIIEMAWSSIGKYAIMPMQDLLRLDTKSRMNIPGTADGNWLWRFQWKQLKKSYLKHLKDMTEKYNR